ncbi:hypothetical protein [Streptomyces sp. NPDC003717]|uniref:hypothetical protein n=1 Tax=Streptomyces sp. NPDC003717 TaxID=3154276 RepID=UPI0033AF3117
MQKPQKPQKPRRRPVLDVAHPENSEEHCPECGCSENEFTPSCDCANPVECPAGCGHP